VPENRKYTIDITPLAGLALIIGAFVFCYFLHLSTVQWPAEQTKNKEWTEQAKNSSQNVKLICPAPENGEAIVTDKCQRSDHYEYDRNQQIIDHKAQVSMRNATWLAVLLTFVGLIMIWRTLGFTREAAGFAESALNEAKEATSATWKALETNQFATKAEFQPYLDFAKRLKLSRLTLTYHPVQEAGNQIVGAVAVVTDRVINLGPVFDVKNRGKTPAKDFDVSFEGKITNTRIVHIEGRRDTITEVFKVSGRTVGPDYLGIDDTRPFGIYNSLIYDKSIADSPNIDGPRTISFLTSVFVFEFIVSFKDEFSERRRAWIASYSGHPDTNWITLGSSRELAETEQEYKDHYEMYQTSLS